MGDDYVEPAVGSTEPLGVLRAELAAARRRGRGFGEAWPVALRVALEGTSQKERPPWRAALENTRSTWERCLLRQPATPEEQALVAAADMVDRQRMADRPCVTCGAEVLSTGRGTPKKYCSTRCRKAASELTDGRATGPKLVPALSPLPTEDWSTDEQLQLAA